MTVREPRTVRVDPDVWSAFVEQVIEWEGQKSGELGRHVENALEEYSDNDRLARVERKVDVLLDRTADSHTHKGTQAAKKTELIAERIGAGGKIIVPDSDVRDAIEDIAGSDDRTRAKYREQLKRRGLAYEHPTGGTWTVERDEWINWVKNHVDNNPANDLQDELDPYPIDFDEYDKVATVVES